MPRTGKTKWTSKLLAPPSLTLIAVDQASGDLWGAGYSDHERGTMALVQLDPATGVVIKTSPATSLGSGWEINALPGIVSVDTAGSALVFPAQKQAAPGKLDPEISLVYLPFSPADGRPRASAGFCTLHTAKTNFTCPKLLRALHHPTA